MLNAFPWPTIEGRRADIVSPNDGTVDFFYLFDLELGRLAWTRPSLGLRFEYVFDKTVFPFTRLFASYGGFDGHYTVILEPCTTMPMHMGEAIHRGTACRLVPGGSLETNVSIFAGLDRSTEA
jgi:hypothetical protein